MIIEKIKDPKRKARLIFQLKKAFKTLGEYIKDGIVNLVPIDVAAETGDLIAVQTRLKAGANPNKHNRRCLIELAAKNNHSHIVNALREHREFNKALLPAAIEAAKAEHHVELAETLAERNINELDENGCTLLGHAIKKGDVEEVRKLISKGADVNLPGRDNYPLQLAARSCYDKQFGRASKNHIEIIKILLENQADPNLTQNNGPTAMCVAGSQGSANALKLLLSVTTAKMPIVKKMKDSSITFPWYMEIMFQSYGSKEWLEILKLLQSEGADINQTSSLGESLLHLVIRGFSSTYPTNHISNHFDFSATTKIKNKANSIHHDYEFFVKSMKLLDFLLTEGVNPNTKSYQHGNTALHDLMKCYGLEKSPGMYAKIIDPCIQHGFDINAENKHGKTLLHLAAAKGRLEAVKYLLARGAHINAVDHFGNTPLHLAMTQSNDPQPEVINCLLCHGANPTLQNKKGYTPLQRMERVACEEINNGSYKIWSEKAKQEWHRGFDQCKSILLNYACPMDDVQYEVDALSESMQSYINEFTPLISNESILASLSIPENEHLILEYYTDPFSKQIMNIPVFLNERLYDLQTLLTLPEDNRRDPVTHALFKLSDIKPAKKTAKELAIILLDLQNKFSDKKEAECSQNGKAFFLFTKTDQLALDSVKPEWSACKA